MGWAVAQHVQILCAAIEKKAADGSFMPEDWIVPLQLSWPYASFPHELLPYIASDRICDLGFVKENGTEFRLCLYISHTRASIKANEAMRVSLIASADNFTSPSPYVLEISWDGKWSSDLEEMQRHLVIKEVQ